MSGRSVPMELETASVPNATAETWAPVAAEAAAIAHSGNHRGFILAHDAGGRYGLGFDGESRGESAKGGKGEQSFTHECLQRELNVAVSGEEDLKATDPGPFAVPPINGSSTELPSPCSRELGI
jgi:hypothetical protein